MEEDWRLMAVIFSASMAADIVIAVRLKCVERNYVTVVDLDL